MTGARRARHSRPGAVAHAWLYGGLAAFVVAMAVLVVASVSRRAVRSFTPTPARAAGDGRARPPGAVDTITIDARDGRAWRRADLLGAAVLAAGYAGTWDLAARRYEVATAAPFVDLGPVDFDGVTRAPADPAARGRSPRDTVVARWYRYDFMAHVLESKRHVYVLRTRGGEWVKLQVVGYYCPGPEAGCLTLRVATLPPPEASPGVAGPAAADPVKQGVPAGRTGEGPDTRPEG